MIHVVPTNDTKEHTLNSVCECAPKLVEQLLIHNSYDGREAVEWAEELLNNQSEHKQWLVIEETSDARES